MRVSIRQQTSVYNSIRSCIRQQTSAHVSIRSVQILVPVRPVVLVSRNFQELYASRVHHMCTVLVLLVSRVCGEPEAQDGCMRSVLHYLNFGAALLEFAAWFRMNLATPSVLGHTARDARSPQPPLQ
jgi:hypothetical protein